ncbi:MAG: glycosyltransferase family 4 protein [Planctomycetes bacterium]|nr:glycosyltransferase family 4 protein [Planctomycetota bacterium]
MHTLLFFHASAELYGSDRTLLELVRRLDRARWRPVVALPRRGPLARELESAGVAVEIGPVGTFGRATLRPRGLLRAAHDLPESIAWARWLIRAQQASLVHTNTAVVLSGALAARAESVPHVWHVHEILERPRLVAGLLARTVSGLSQRVVCNSHATAANLSALFPPVAERCRVVHNGIPDFTRTPARAAARAALGIDPGDECVALVGRINHWKGQGLLLDACARLRARHPRLRLLFCGDAPPGQPALLEALEARIAHSTLAERVLRLGFREDVEQVYAAADVVCVPSTLPEPFGLVAAEAMALERPVVAAAHGGLPEIVVEGETGLLVPPRDPEALARAIGSLLDDPARAAALGRAGRARQREHFSLESHVRALEALYAELLPRALRVEERVAA